MFSVVKTFKYWFAFSGVLMLASLALFFIWGLRPGTDFRGGSLWEIEFGQNVSPNKLKEQLNAGGFSDVTVQSVSEKTVIIKTAAVEQSKLSTLRENLANKYVGIKELRFESIGPAISRELVRNAYWQIVLVCLGILLYISYAFRKIGKQAKKTEVSPWRLGLAAIVALIHDLIITVGFFVVLGKYRGVEIDSLFVTALLTILGFSVHDTIVVYDRIRENLQKYPYKAFGSIIDHSIHSTLARSINTSSTLIFVLIAMLLFGGQTVFNFVLALLLGVSVGTYSSIFVASPLLYLWRKDRAQ